MEWLGRRYKNLNYWEAISTVKSRKCEDNIPKSIFLIGKKNENTVGKRLDPNAIVLGP